jgi:phage regulator Rha-like protein
MQQLIKSGIVTSLELVEQINTFREQDGNKTLIGHNDLLKVIRDEFDEEISLGEISQSNYLNERGRSYIMFELTKVQAIQVLTRESKFVRKAIIYKLDSLENKPKSDAISQIEQHTHRPNQIQSSKDANNYAFTKQGGKEDAIDWNRKTCFYFTGKHLPSGKSGLKNKMCHRRNEQAVKKWFASSDQTVPLEYLLLIFFIQWVSLTMLL